MRTVGIKVLKNKLSEYVRAAAAGETVLVTDRERVVAEMTPPRSRRSSSMEAILERGRQEGWYTPATRSWHDFAGGMKSNPDPQGDPDVPFDEILADLARDREDR